MTNIGYTFFENKNLGSDMAKLGLALGGGGARGLAHIGVLKVLEENGIIISAISGCSMGAVIGALYAYYKNAVKVESLVLDMIENTDFKKLGFDLLQEKKKNDEISLFDNFSDYVKVRYQLFKSLNRLSYFEEEVAERLFAFIPDIKLEELKIKFSAIATDLLSGEEINFTSGSLRQIVRASSAIPAIFPPVSIDNKLLVDGAASESVPVNSIKELGADRVLSVDVTRCLHTQKKPDNIFDLLYRVEDITSFHLSKIRLENSDLTIRPSVRKLDWSEFLNAEDIIKAGENAAQESLEEIKNLVDKNYYLLEMEKFVKKIKD